MTRDGWWFYNVVLPKGAEFGMTAEYAANPDGRGWSVSLPHQCSSWDITEEWDREPRAVAVERLRLFIAEAQGVLAALEAAEDDPPNPGEMGAAR